MADSFQDIIPSSGSQLPKYAVWAVTRGGIDLARVIQNATPGIDVYFSKKLKAPDFPSLPFDRLRDQVQTVFSRYSGHIFIMATGIVVRIIAPLIQHKTVDPAVVVLDDLGRYAISLLSGHIGGANDLARSVAEWTGSVPVITTATDSHNLPAIDVLAVRHGLYIENPAAIKSVNMAFLTGQPVALHDPHRWVKDHPDFSSLTSISSVDLKDRTTMPVVKITDENQLPISDNILILRPRSLAVGIGCNRNTPTLEIRQFLKDTFQSQNLSLKSIFCLATIDIKANETGILETAEWLNIPVRFYSKEQLKEARGIERPSEMVKKHVGVTSVCEAAALLAAGTTHLMVPKLFTPNVTLAVARAASTLLE